MPQNPFITRADWKKDKTKYGIPDKVVSYSFGEKMESLNKKFDKAGLSGPMTLAKVPAAEELVKEANKVFKEYIAGLGKLQPAAIKDKAGALQRLKVYQGFVDGLARAAEGAVDPFAGPRHDYDKCLTLMLNAVKHPTDATAMQNLYSQGMRNHLGATFHAALTTYKGLPEVENLLKGYEALLKKWHGDLQGNGPATLVQDQAKTKSFLEDMQDAMKMAVRILAVTKP